MAYALPTHEKCNALQIVRQVVKEKKIHLQLVLLGQVFGVTQPMAKSLNVLVGFKFVNLLGKEANRLQATQSSGGSRSRQPPPFGASRLNTMRFLKPKVEPSLGRSTSQNLFKSSSSLHSRKMSKLCRKHIQSVNDVGFKTNACIRTLKKEVEKIHSNLVQKEGEQRRAHLHVDNRKVIHHEVKNDLDKVKAYLEKTLFSCVNLWVDLRFFKCCVLMRTQMMKQSLI